MKTTLFLILFVLSFTSCSSQGFKDGDIIFHTSKSSQSKMIQLVTNSKLTHCGIIFYQKGKPFVLEAVQPVKVTPLNQWIARGVGGKYIVSRSKKPLTKSQLGKMYDYGKSLIGKDYDLKFQWSDKKMYCSELIYKVYIAGDIFVGEPKKFSEYNLDSKLAKDAIKSRYGNSININEMVITPVDIYRSSEVRTIYDNY